MHGQTTLRVMLAPGFRTRINHIVELPWSEQVTFSHVIPKQETIWGALGGVRIGHGAFVGDKRPRLRQSQTARVPASPRRQSPPELTA